MTRRNLKENSTVYRRQSTRSLGFLRRAWLAPLLILLCTGFHAWANDESATATSAGWHQWGGPDRNFKVTAGALADRWSADGPPRLWVRPLGEGLSSIVADADRLYTMYRQGEDEIIVALRADTGDTVWEHRYSAAPYAEQTRAHGQGPNATPLILKDRLITVGFTGLMHCLDVVSGRVLWSHDLVKEFGGKIQYYGYSISPIAYRGTVIALVGGAGCGAVALNPQDGSVAWKSPTYDVSHASPILIKVDGQDQLVFFSTKAVIGIDPRNGAFLWSHPVINFCKTNCTAALWGADNLLWAATKGVGGTRVLRLTQRDGKTNVAEVWFDRKIRIYHWNAIRVGDYVYASIGENASFLSVIDVKTGQVIQRERGFASANGILANGKLIFLDHAGKLALAEITPGKLEVVSSNDILDTVTWTPPTLVGKTLYVRDRQRIMALDLGVQNPAHTSSTKEISK